MPATLRREDLHAPALSALPGCTLVPGSSATLRFEAGGTSTQMACAPQVMRQATAYLSSLSGAASYRVDAEALQLLGADGILLLPTLGMVAVTKFPIGVDEYEIAGGLAGEPLELIKCKTVPLEVPSTAEVIIEGEVDG